MTRFLFVLVLFSFSFCFAALAQAVQELQFWHSSAGPAGAALEQLVARFNGSQTRYRINAVYKEQLGPQDISAVRTQDRPHLIQLDDTGTGTLMAAPALVKPLWQVMAEAGAPLDKGRLMPVLAGQFLDPTGRLAAWPFAAATPVLFSNKALLRIAGLDPESVPRIWYEMPKLLGELYEKGIACPYTTAWPSWVQIENLAAWHNQAFATRGNGLGGAGATLTFNTQLMIRHVATLASWAKARYFIYAGRRDEGEQLFAKGECALLTSSSASYEMLQNALGAELGVSALPYYDDIPEAPQNTLAKGSALWVVAGKLAADYRGLAEFIAFLTSVGAQAEWHQKTGYLPLSREAYEITKKAGFYERYAGWETAIAQMLAKPPRENSRGIRLPHLLQIRDIIDEELEAAWLLKKMPKEALDDALERGNKLLKPAGGPRHR